MAIVQYSKIELTDYNNMQSASTQRLTKVGTQGGMGQSTEYASVLASGTTIAASHLANLRTDISRLTSKCFNTAPTGGTVNQNGKILYSEWNAYATDISSINSNYWKLNSVHAEVISIFSKSSVAFATALQPSVRFTWASADALEAFFNMGGDLRFTFSATQSQSPYAGSTKAAAYNAMFNSVGTVVIGHEVYSSASTYSSGPSTGVTTFTGFNSVVSASTASPYPSNTFVVAVARDSSVQVHVRFAFNDVSGPNPNVDEAITVAVVGTYRQPKATVGGFTFTRYPPTLGTIFGWQ